MKSELFCHAANHASHNARFCAVFISAAALLFSATTVRAQNVYTWTGGGGSGKQEWSKNNNWSGVGAPSDYTTNSFVFGGAWREFAPNNDRIGLVAASLLFSTNSSTNAQSYNLTGNNLILIGGVTNLSIRWHTISLGLVLGTNTVNFDTASNNLTLAGVVSGNGALVKSGAHTLFLTAANSYSGGTLVKAGAIRGDATSLRGIITNNASVIFDQATNGVYAGSMSGAGALFKTGAGTLTLSGANALGGGLNVQSGVLELAAKAGASAGSVSSVAVSQGATLLISKSNQVNDKASVTLSGGTILRVGGASETFGDLYLTQASFLDFGDGAPGTLGFGAYTPSALLAVSGFLPGNVLSFRSDLSATIGNSSFFKFDNGFVSLWESGSGVFTITAIPEPATCVAAAGLASLLLWPATRKAFSGGAASCASAWRCAGNEAGEIQTGQCPAMMMPLSTSTESAGRDFFGGSPTLRCIAMAPAMSTAMTVAAGSTGAG
jgi:autotransporter-associated beta strand protein